MKMFILKSSKQCCIILFSSYFYHIGLQKVIFMQICSVLWTCATSIPYWPLSLPLFPWVLRLRSHHQYVHYTICLYCLYPKIIEAMQYLFVWDWLNSIFLFFMSFSHFSEWEEYSKRRHSVSFQWCKILRKCEVIYRYRRQTGGWLRLNQEEIPRGKWNFCRWCTSSLSSTQGRFCKSIPTKT